MTLVRRQWKQTAEDLRSTDENLALTFRELDGEPTGDVDMFAAFTAPDTIVVGDCFGSDPINTEILDRNAQRLAQVVTALPPHRGECAWKKRSFAHFGLFVSLWGTAGLPRLVFVAGHVGITCSSRARRAWK